MIYLLSAKDRCNKSRMKYKFSCFTWLGHSGTRSTNMIHKKRAAELLLGTNSIWRDMKHDISCRIFGSNKIPKAESLGELHVVSWPIFKNNFIYFLWSWHISVLSGLSKKWKNIADLSCFQREFCTLHCISSITMLAPNHFHFHDFFCRRRTECDELLFYWNGRQFS